jgi:hypothetical protein
MILCYNIYVLTQDKMSTEVIILQDYGNVKRIILK